jgi:tartrate-resistant acid phosphatase type 5
MDAVLGNHDYTGNALAQLDPAIRNVDSRYTVLAKSFIVNSGNQIKYSIRPKKKTHVS